MIIMSTTQKIIGFVAFMSGVAVLGVMVWTWGLYNASLKEQEVWLSRLAKSQAQIIESVASFDSVYSTKDHPGGSSGATLSQIEAAHIKYSHFGKTGEFVWGRRQGDAIVFPFERRFSDQNASNTVPFNSNLAIPMQLALLGQSGTVIGPDYRNVDVLAAYEPIKGLKTGLVAKMDIAEIRTPFIKVSIIAGLSAFIIVLIGSFVTQKVLMTLNRAKEKADKASQAKSEFLAAMSHDLRTPLNAIMGFSDMMRSGVYGPLGNPLYVDYVNDIHNSGSLLVSLINDVLDLSKIEAGKYELQEKTLDISSIIQDSSRQLEAMAKAADLTVSIIIPPNMPDMIGDERVLTQILNNLISNAIKFTKEKGKITVSSRVSVDHKIILSVSDTGIGMTPSGIIKALQPFEQAGRNDSSRYDGTGLGLHLCTKFMELFGGSLEIESQPEKGTSVTLTFPPERTLLQT